MDFFSRKSPRIPWIDFAVALTIAFLIGCSNGSQISLLSEPAEAVAPSAVPPAGLEPYGLDGELNESEIKALLYLQFPQSYEAISERFGFPAYRDSTADYYKLPNSRWVAIYYSGYTATGYRFSDSGD
ncbi:hypothetical protein N836_24360 [Leptolyngbya sp. Heron Island J]|nr:hypothetical protein N836_24360 [Leptolyngbya sp. Heron Island J]